MMNTNILVESFGNLGCRSDGSRCCGGLPSCEDGSAYAGQQGELRPVVDRNDGLSMEGGARGTEVREIGSMRERGACAKFACKI
jgi:hypothetical protein